MYVQKPPMGWNTWNTFGPHITDELVRETAQAMIDRGLKDAGYEYVVIDDCWSLRERDEKTGKIVADPEKFPNGMKNLSDFIHSKGMKFGMYSCCGVRTCANYPGSFDHEFLDAETFAEFGVDFLKYDNCFRPQTAHSPTLYHRMGTALALCGRDILFSACNWGCDDVWSWIRSAGAHMYRSTGDIFDSFQSFWDIAMSQYKEKKFAASAPNCFNDMDMLTVGMYGGTKHLPDSDKGCTADGYRAQFALWCMAASPLMIGCDVRNVDDDVIGILTNKDLIAINQDPDARPPFKINDQVYAKRLAGGDFAILCLNDGDKERGRHIFLEEMGISAVSGYKLELTDLYTGEKLPPVKEFVTVRVPAKGCRVFRAKPIR